jgi:carboxyl-terminal processing protease
MRRLAAPLLAGVLAFFAGFAASGAGHAQARANVEDFDVLWRAIDRDYAYAQTTRATWHAMRTPLRRRTAAAKTRDELVAALEGALEILHDDQVALSEPSRAAPRQVPADADVWAEWRDGRAVVTAVRTFGDADVAGVHPGQVITRIDGVDVRRVVEARARASGAVTPLAMDWALRRCVAGPRRGVVRLTVADASGERIAEVERSGAPPAPIPPLVVRRIGEDRDIGYVRIKNSLGDPHMVASFDAALDALKDTRALILDLRETQDGGERAVVEAILARFVTQSRAWEMREDRAGRRIVDRVEPRYWAYRAPLGVLVDRWTAGEGEALAAGLDAVAGATLIGTPMARLLGAARAVRLPHSGITVRFGAEKTFHVNGAPRETIEPRVAVDLAAPSGGPGDPILYQALKRFER